MAIIDFNARQHVAASVRRKAYHLDTSWRNGEKVCKCLLGSGYLKMDIGLFWRLSVRTAATAGS